MKEMKKMNRKGFTLVELLVVLVILVVIMAVAIPSVTSSLERSKQKQKDSKIELVLSAAEIYVDRHKNQFGNSNQTYYIYINQLICDSELTAEQAKDPFNEKYTLDGYVELYNNIYRWKDGTAGNYYKIKIDELSC